MRFFPFTQQIFKSKYWLCCTSQRKFCSKKKLTVPQKWLSECDSFFVLINNRCMFELAIVYICVTIKSNVFLFHCKIYLYIFFALFMDLSPLTHLCRCMRRQSRIRVTNISRYVSTQVSNKLYTFVLWWFLEPISNNLEQQYSMFFFLG